MQMIIDSARIVGHGPTERNEAGDLCPSISVAIDYVGCYEEIPLRLRQRIGQAIERKLGLAGWTAAGRRRTETGEVWTYHRPARRPGHDACAARIVKSYRVHPDTAAAIDAEAKATGESQGQVLDRWARG